MIETYVFIDCETGGLDVEKHELLTVTAVLTDRKFNVLHGVHALLEGPDDGTIDPEVLAINKFNEYPEPHNVLWFGQIAEDLRNIIDGSLWMGSNPYFDFDFIMKEYDELGWRRPKPASHHLIDVCSAALPFMCPQGSSNCLENLQQFAVLNYFGMGEQQHNSLGDTVQLIRIAEKLTHKGIA